MGRAWLNFDSEIIWTLPLHLGSMTCTVVHRGLDSSLYIPVYVEKVLVREPDTQVTTPLPKPRTTYYPSDDTGLRTVCMDWTGKPTGTGGRGLLEAGSLAQLRLRDLLYPDSQAKEDAIHFRSFFMLVTERLNVPTRETMEQPKPVSAMATNDQGQTFEAWFPEIDEL